MHSDDTSDRFLFNPAAEQTSLELVESQLGFALPADYKSFLKQYDGGEGFIGEQYLVLWRASELLPFNADYQVEKYAPGFLVFGSNGGGEAFAFDTRHESKRVVMLPFIGMSRQDALPLTETFDAFLSGLAAGTIL